MHLCALNEETYFSESSSTSNQKMALYSLNRSGNIVCRYLLFFLSLADRMFRLMDTNKDGFLNFQEVAKTFNLLCKGDHVLKLRLFYCLHLPGMVLPGELEELNKPHFGEETEVDGPEEG